MATRPFTMYLSFNNGAEAFEFPVLPEKITIGHEGDNNEYEIVGLGKINAIGKAKLAEISFESFFPAQSGPYVAATYRDQADWKPDPNYFVNLILRWQASGYPVRFIFVGQDAENDKNKINIAVTIESFERWEEGGSPGDIFYSLELKAYTFYYPQKAKVVTNTKTGEKKVVKEAKKRPDERVPAKTYTVKKNDTLSKISRSVLGDSGRWREIQKLNKLTDADLLKLKIGQVLQLPSK